jgi:hypothetical protein
MGKNTSVISVIAGLLLLISTVFSHGSGGKKGSEGTVNPDLDFAQIEYVKATEASNGSWRFDVTVRHNDEGWDHYADAWQVVDPKNGKVLGERILAHPHETEQPFARSQSGITVPNGLIRVLVRAKCNVHGFGGREVLVDLSQSEGDGYRVEGHGN